MQRALDVEDDAGQAQAALLGGDEVVLGAPLDLRVDQRGGLGVGAGLEDEDPAQAPELRGGEADAHAVAHDREHPLDVPAQLVVEVLDGGRPRLQDRVAELDHLRERGGAALEGVVVELGRVLGLLDLLVHVLVHRGILDTSRRAGLLGIDVAPSTVRSLKTRP